MSEDKYNGTPEMYQRIAELEQALSVRTVSCNRASNKIEELEAQLTEAKQENLEQRVRDICTVCTNLDGIRFSIWTIFKIKEDKTFDIEELDQGNMFIKQLTDWLIEQGVDV